MMHNVNVKTFEDISRHFELEDECLNAAIPFNKATFAKSNWDLKRKRGNKGNKAPSHLGNNSKVLVLGISTCQLHMCGGKTLILHDVLLYAPEIHRRLVSVLALLKLGFSLNFHDMCFIHFYRVCVFWFWLYI